jgi:uncharacterized membrane protein
VGLLRFGPAHGFPVHVPVHHFMIWNVLLATVPVGLALVLFRRRERGSSFVWWCGFGAWVLFLPNAPYILTDVVHMVDDVQATPSRLRAYEILGVYGVFFAVGLASYVISLQLFRRFMHRVAPPRIVAPVMLTLHGLCVVAMYLGRFVRLNSWDAVLAPGDVAASMMGVPRASTVALLASMFVVVGASAFATAVVGQKVLAEVRRLAS